jgi:hemoglobin
MNNRAAAWALAGWVVFAAGCATEPEPAATGGRMEQPAGPSLYDRLGKKEAITAVVDDFVARVGADSRINGLFAKANIARLKTLLADQICEAAGGPCKYTGRDMKTVHAGMRISSAQFDALVGDLVASLNKFKVGEREKKELLGLLGPMKADIVTAM